MYTEVTAHFNSIHLHVTFDCYVTELQNAIVFLFYAPMMHTLYYGK